MTTSFMKILNFFENFEILQFLKFKNFVKMYMNITTKFSTLKLLFFSFSSCLTIERSIVFKTMDRQCESFSRIFNSATGLDKSFIFIRNSWTSSSIKENSAWWLQVLWKFWIFLKILKFCNFWNLKILWKFRNFELWNFYFFYFKILNFLKFLKKIRVSR
jgi:hypothetical protein